MANEKIISTRIVLTHDDYTDLKDKHLKEGEVVLAKVGELTEGNVTQPVFMMKVGTADTTKTVENLPWLMAPAADVYGWAKQEHLEASAVPTLEIAKISGLQDALDALAAEDERLAGLIAGKADEEHTHVVADITDYETDFATKIQPINQEIAKKADKVTDAVKGNFAGLDENGNLTDSGSKAADFAEAEHTHEAADITDFSNSVKDVVNTMELATDEVVDAIDGRLTTAEGEIDVLQTAVNTTLPGQINAKVDQSAYDEKVAALEKADTDEAAARELLAGRVSTLEAKPFDTYATKTELTDGLALKADKATYEAKVAELVEADEALDEAVKAAQKAAEDAQADIDAFFTGAEQGQAALDTLKEIQDFLASDDGTVQTLLDDVAGLKEADVTLQGNIDKKADQTTVDGIEDRVEALEAKPFDTYATKTEVENVDKKFANYTTTSDLTTLLADKEEAGAAAKALEDAKKYTDDEIAELDLANTYDAKGAADDALEAAKKYTDDEITELNLANTYAAKDHDHYVGDITDYETDVAAKIKVETDARVEAVNGLQGQIDGIKSTADAAVKSVAADAATGLKVDTVEGAATIKFIEDVVFVLDGGTADNLD